MGARGQAVIKMLLILVFSVVSLLYIYICIIFHQQSLVLLLRQVLKGAKDVWSHVKILYIYYIYMCSQPNSALLFPTASWEEQKSRASPAGRDPELPVLCSSPRLGRNRTKPCSSLGI